MQIQSAYTKLQRPQVRIQRPISWFQLGFGLLSSAGAKLKEFWFYQNSTWTHGEATDVWSVTLLNPHDYVLVKEAWLFSSLRSSPSSPDPEWTIRSPVITMAHAERTSRYGLVSEHLILASGFCVRPLSSVQAGQWNRAPRSWHRSASVPGTTFVDITAILFSRLKTLRPKFVQPGVGRSGVQTQLS